MQEKIKKLIGLQECDARIAFMEAKKMTGPRQIKILEEQLEKLEAELNDETERLEECKKSKRDVDSEIENIDSRMEKSNGKLADVKSNKEYAAALKEIENLKKEKGLLEDRAIELMEQVDALDSLKAEKAEELEKAKKAFKADHAVIVKEMGELDVELEELRSNRDSISGDIDRELLGMYDHLRKFKDGIAISPVTGGVCQACHMGIPPQKYNELIRGEELLNCPNCHRIMYWGDNEDFKKAANKA